MTATVIFRKAARDGAEITVTLVRDTTGTTPTAGMDVTKAGRPLVRGLQARPHQLDNPTGDITHGLPLGPDRALGLTTAEADLINTALDADRAQVRASVDQAELAAVLADLTCQTCGHRLSDLDIATTSVEGHCRDCV